MEICKNHIQLLDKEIYDALSLYIQNILYNDKHFSQPLRQGARTLRKPVDPILLNPPMRAQKPTFKKLSSANYISNDENEDESTSFYQDQVENINYIVNELNSLFDELHEEYLEFYWFISLYGRIIARKKVYDVPEKLVSRKREFKENLDFIKDKILVMKDFLLKILTECNNI